MAAIVHDSPQLTHDLDFVYDRSGAKIDRVVGALDGLQPYLPGAIPGLAFKWDRATIARRLPPGGIGSISGEAGGAEPSEPGRFVT